MNLLLCFFGESLELFQLGMMIVNFLGPFDGNAFSDVGKLSTLVS